MQKRMKSLNILVLAVTLAAFAFAQGRGRGGDAPAGKDKPARGESGRDSKTKPAGNEDVTTEYFKTCDYDQDGWITFNEARQSLGLDQKGFGVYDTDIDGRISQAEFTARYESIIAHGGVFLAPIARADKHKAPKRSAQELLEAFDADRDGALDQTEIGRALADYGVRDVDAARVLAIADHDASGRVEASELQAVIGVLEPNSATEHKKAGSIAELFDQIEPRKVERGDTQQPAHILGPVSTFRRLDYDQNGTISVADLEALQRPMQLPVRIRAVLAVLDTDKDGVLSPSELKAALQ
jgi:Ca2+-binding EF-hand superfamily protein